MISHPLTHQAGNGIFKSTVELFRIDPQDSVDIAGNPVCGSWEKGGRIAWLLQ